MSAAYIVAAILFALYRLDRDSALTAAHYTVDDTDAQG